MADIVLKDRNGNDVTYEGIETVTFDTPTEGEQIVFTEGVKVEGIEIGLDMSNGDQTITAPEGTLVKSAVIKKPDAMKPENIRSGVDIGGVVGDFIGDTEETTMELSMADGDQIVEPSANGKVLSKVTIAKPETLVPENIVKDVEIAGIVGTHKGEAVDWSDLPIPETIRFVDFKGTIVDEWTLEEAQEKTELPQPIEYEGFVFQEWNYTLEEIKDANWPLDVGAVYITDDGATRLILDVNNSSYLLLYMYCTINGTVEISWGDGSVEEKSGTGVVTVAHTYSSTGNYTISVKVPEGSTFGLGSTSSSSNSVISHNTSANRTAIHKYLKGLYIGARTQLNKYATYYHAYLSEITIPNYFTSIAERAFYSQYATVSLVIPRSVTALDTYAVNSLSSGAREPSILSLPRTIESLPTGMFGYSKILRINPLPLVTNTTNLYNACYYITKAYLPDGITAIGNNCFQYCYNLKQVDIPDGVTSIGDWAFNECRRLKRVELPTTLTSIGTYTFYQSSVENITVPEGVTSIGSNCFTYSRIKRLVIPESMVDFNTGALNTYARPDDLIIKGANLTSIPTQMAFRTVFLSETPPSCLTKTYISDKGLFFVYVPDAAMDTYRAIFADAYAFYVRPLSEYQGELPD